MDKPAVFRVVVHGQLDLKWVDRLAGMNLSEKRTANGEIYSILVGRLADQAALSSVLNILYELHFPVVSVDYLGND